MAKVGDEGGSSIYFETDQGNSKTHPESSTWEPPRLGEHWAGLGDRWPESKSFLLQLYPKLHILKYFNKREISVYISLNNIFNAVSPSFRMPTAPQNEGNIALFFLLQALTFYLPPWTFIIYGQWKGWSRLNVVRTPHCCAAHIFGRKDGSRGELNSLIFIKVMILLNQFAHQILVILRSPHKHHGQTKPIYQHMTRYYPSRYNTSPAFLPTTTEESLFLPKHLTYYSGR